MKLVRSHLDDPTRNTRLRGGVTLIELVVVVLILGVVASIAIPNMTDSMHNTRVTTAASRVAADLAMARSHAVAASTTVTVQFNAASETYSIPLVDHPDKPGESWAVNLTEYPHNCLITSANLGGDPDIQFDLYGQVDSGGVITLNSGGSTQTVTVNADSGKATVP